MLKSVKDHAGANDTEIAKAFCAVLVGVQHQDRQALSLAGRLKAPHAVAECQDPFGRGAASHRCVLSILY